jgi:phosphoribosylglycinamide formyltransferase-1
MTKLALGILISGRGSNMVSLVDAALAADYPARPVLVLSNRPTAAGLIRAQALGVETDVVDHKAFGTDREAHERAIDARLREKGVEIIALAGYMRVLTPWFVRRWQGRMVNIHPSLLPKYPGLNTHARALAAGDTEAGCSVHWVTEGVDAGEVIARASITICPDDTAERLAERLLPEEHRLYPEALRQACDQILTRDPSAV